MDIGWANSRPTRRLNPITFFIFTCWAVSIANASQSLQNISAGGSSKTEAGTFTSEVRPRSTRRLRPPGAETGRRFAGVAPYGSRPPVHWAAWRSGANEFLYAVVSCFGRPDWLANGPCNSAGADVSAPVGSRQYLRDVIVDSSHRYSTDYSLRAETLLARTAARPHRRTLTPLSRWDAERKPARSASPAGRSLKRRAQPQE